MLDVSIILITSILLMLFSSDILVKSILEFSEKFDIPPYLLTFFSISLGSALPETINSIVLSLNKFQNAGFFNIINAIVTDFTLILGFLLLLNKKVKYGNRKLIYFTMIIFIVFLFSIIDGVINNFEGLLLFSLYGIIAMFLIKGSKKEYRKHINISLRESIKYSFLISSSFAILLINSHIIYSVVNILISFMKVKEYIIGFFLGVLSSFPEFLVAAMYYLRYKNIDLALYNLFGTFIADISLGIGIPSSILPIVLNNMFNVYLASILIYFSLMLAGLSLLESRIPKEIGYFLIGGYLLYLMFYL